MNVSHRWLRELAPSVPADPNELAERLALLGAPVDEMVPLGDPIGDVLIARVDAVRQHPNADRLRVCTVDAGTGETLQVVCGAPNVEAGGFYPFAPVGAALPGGIRISKAKLRGEISHGMLCSARELGLGRDHAGLLALAGEWEPGTRFVDALELDDTRLVVDVTPNRPDLLSHLGIAREAAGEGVNGVRLPPFPGAGGGSLDLGSRGSEIGGITIRVDDAGGCPRYMAAVVRGVRIAPSPEWLATRLRAIGLRPINNVVDATNYVLHEIGQPLHAFDLARLGGGEVRVRRAEAGETMRTLDAVDRALEPGDLVIADATRPVALAGVMGGADSEVSEQTREVLIECARFDPRAVRRTARRLGLSTDASYRFEREVDPEGLPLALRRVVELIVAIAGGTPEPGVADVADPGDGDMGRRLVALRPEKVQRVLGVPLAPPEIASLLTPIGFDVGDEAGEMSVVVPSWRPDVARPIDLIEEIARRRGFDTFAGELGAFRPSAVPEDPLFDVQRRLRAVFTRWGFLEARTAAFAPAADGRVPVWNPLSQEESSLRDSLVPGLLRRVEHNWAHGVRDVRLFEIGTVFSPASGPKVPPEQIRVAAVFTGARTPGNWRAGAEPWELWDLKGLMVEVARELGAHVRSDRDALRLVTAQEQPAGHGGEVPREQLDAPAWAGPVWHLEAPVPAAHAAPAGVRYTPLPAFPATERDLALLVPDGVPASEVETVIRTSAGPTLETLQLFDQFSGAGIPAGTRSLAWRLRFRAADRTLMDAEVDNALSRTLRTLEDRFGIRRR